MIYAAIALTVLCSLIALVWVSRHIMIFAEKRRGFILDENYRGKSAQRPFVSVVVAAKDEQENIERCVRSMLAQEYDNFEMIVCNDRSSDRTAEIVEVIAREDSRVRLINITHLPEGWGGKNNAMQTGIKEARGEWICMIDADCEQTSRRSLSAAVEHALDSGSDLLSVLPVLEMKGFWENVVQPVCGGVMIIWFHPDKVNSPRYPNAYANGAFMLMRREAYDAIGGHAAVRTCVNEDMHMAALVKQAGLKLRVVRNVDLYTVRMYTSLKQIFRGWSRIFYGTFVTFKRIAVSLAVLTIVSMLPYTLAALGWSMALGDAQPQAWWWACAIAATIAVALQMGVMVRYYRLTNARASLAWTYFLGACVAFACLVSALGKLRKGAKIVWRNTSYAAAGTQVTAPVIRNVRTTAPKSDKVSVR